MPRRGKLYPNRTDLSTAAPARYYGQEAELAQQAAAIPSKPKAPPSVAPQPQPSMLPPSPLPFDRPTERPNEPVTAGMGVMGDDPLSALRAMFLRYPSEDLRDLIEEFEE